MTIGSELSVIPKDCFSGSGLVSITMPDNITSLGEETFQECASLAEVNLGKGLRQIPDRCFQNSGIKSISIPSNVTSIGVEAFADCAALETADLGTGLREIPENCFKNSGLTAITLPKNVTTVGEKAFYNCFSLHSVTVSGPKTFGNDAFNWSDNIQSVYIDDLADWCERTTFANDYASPFQWQSDETQRPSLYVGGELVENLVIPDGVVRIGDNSFRYCYSIKSVVVPDGVVSIGAQAFYCPELTKATIGKTVNSIGYNAFSCNKLTEFTSLNPVPPTGSGLNYNYNFTVYVPAGSLDAYKSSEDWRYFNIQELGSGVEGIDGGEVSVSVVDGRIVISGADDDTVVEVYDMSGRKVYAGTATEIPATAGGVCIVRISGQAFKVIL